MMPLSQVAQVLGGELVGQDVEFSAVSTDSRSISPGDLFVALHGEKFDGSQYVSLAAEKGAVGALVNAGSYHGEAMPCPIVLVKDTRLALGRLAGYWRDQFAIPLVGITGSNGKTTVKEMLTAILREAAGSEEAVLATQGNFNNDIGMPLTLLRLRKHHQYAVIEMGMNHAGEIDYLTRIARPDVALINNAGSAHIANLGSLEAIAQAKGEIFAGLSKQGTAIINADENFAPMWRVLAGVHTVLEFALDALAPIKAKVQAIDYIQFIEVETPVGNFTAQLHVPGLHNVRNALAATAAAIALKVPPAKIAAGLEKFSGVAGRLQRIPALNGAVVIDDSYNANPMSLRAAMQVLSQAKGNKILVLGDMGELGIEASKMHAEMGAEARKLGVNQMYALGELSSYAVKEFGAGAQLFQSIEDLLAALKVQLNGDCTVLVKGSRFMKMERVVKELVNDKAEAAGAASAHH
ncbi:MAG TPA: UDP-N-acetylmuramoyl-tripeptide--D-alanyl-D-alanine ligase [Gallionellaceae bacterium]|nr:UDP-N-acetylmuramoyl-tripeptide--D-alanyl-D-alanine ligase [Gallionellaceae bacterium]